MTATPLRPPLLLLQHSWQRYRQAPVLLARSKGSAGFSLNDAVLALDPAVELAELRRVLDDLQQHELLLISNDEQGRVVYREP